MGGLIILPDSWTLPSECSFTSGFTTYDGNNDLDWTHNSYTLAQWAQMKGAGAVFLPAAGYRDGTSVCSVGNYGYYWSSEPGYEIYAYTMSFGSYYLYATDYNFRDYGFSVRPVLDN